jgi:multidrug efflux pump subunit AcrA (membrane-fusion protein)
MTFHSFLVKDELHHESESCFSSPVFASFALYPIFFCLFPLLLLALAGCRAKAPVAADQPVPVEVRLPKQVSEPVSVRASGEVEATVTALCAFQIAGRVSRVLVEEGQPVRKGQLLAELDPADYRNGYDAAHAQAEQAAAVDQKAQAGLRAQELEQARIDFAEQQDQYNRMKFLFDHQSLAANDFNKVEASYKAAAERYRMAEEGTRKEDRQAARAQSHAAVAQLHEAQKKLTDTHLVAPVAGFIGMKRVDVGDSVGSGTPVISVLALDPVKVRVAIPEAEIGKVRMGARAVVTIPSLDSRSFEGAVDAVGVAADPGSRTYTVKIAVANQEHLLKAGMVAEARIFSDRQMNALTVPGDAIVHDAHGVTQVFVLDAGRNRVYAHRVDAGDVIGSEIEIRSGLAVTDQAVIAGQQNVREGSPVIVAGGAR